MRFGKTLQSSIYAPWRDYYIDYAKLKRLLHEGDDSDSERGPTSRTDESYEGRPWTENDESVFVEELINVQLEKVNNFQRMMGDQLKERTAKLEARMEKLSAASGDDKKEEISEDEKQKLLKQTLDELDAITSDIDELKVFSRVNFTGFLKAAKKHDRRPRGAPQQQQKGKGKGKASSGVGEYKIRPLLQVRLSALEFNKEDYSPLLYRLSAMDTFIRENLKDGPGQTRASSVASGPQAGHRKYTSHKFWVHPSNVAEVKTFIQRRLPILIYNPQPSKEIEANRRDPTINSLYFDNPKFSLYTDKISKTPEAASLRLRWYGQLSQKPDISIERKTLKGGAAENDSEGAIEERIVIKEKYVKDFINGSYSMEKNIQKMKDRGNKSEDVNRYEALVESLQAFIKEKNLEPVMRAVYTRTAFQIPGDDRIRVSLDTDLALIREDSLDLERPCRDPEDWHRQDIDDAQMEYPFNGLRKGEISRFPYALLEIKVLESALRGRSKEWVQDLMNSHLIKSAPRFSKFAHGVAVLFDDHVNSFPFWLSELDKDIRQDPKQAWEAEQEKAKKQIEDETIVGSFIPGARDFGGRAGAPRSAAGGYSQTPPNADRRFPMIMQAGGAGKKQPQEDVVEVNSEDTDEDEDDTGTDDEDKPTTVATIAGLRNLFPTFSTSRYGHAHRAAVKLPPGVQKPGTLIMHSGPVQVEAKVWLANQRTFLKWQHVSILLASLSIGLYNAAGPHNVIARWLALVYTCIAVFAAGWGYGMYMWRSKLIRERSGKDFNNALGPVVVCVALAVALAVNFAFQYRAAMEKHHRHHRNGTELMELGAETAKYLSGLEL
ncbi:uncharacterized protein H6S33_010264 [Morchella sextelata]|uniref:uncharacterized protein n=1 Tax=Morchella sextelata TaxID=1174677 RepID=UPI001D04C7EC|nr:uncharacterized protein H6S33_010264 [Morchella sextelata]KAH0612212.1 hypothetical protein H6S33_010264 [Morchella sextelata]